MRPRTRGLHRVHCAFPRVKPGSYRGKTQLQASKVKLTTGDFESHHPRYHAIDPAQMKIPPP